MAQAGGTPQPSTAMKRLIPLLLLGLAMAAPASAQSAPGGIAVSGTARATVVQPIVITNTAAMSFGSIVRPTAAGTVTLSTAGTVTATGGAAGNLVTGASGPAPAAGEFQILSAPGRTFAVFAPIAFNLTNGGASMPVSLLTGALQTLSTTPATITYRLRVGATVTLAANQALGTYNGSYTLIAVYQ